MRGKFVIAEYKYKQYSTIEDLLTSKKLLLHKEFKEYE